MFSEYRRVQVGIGKIGIGGVDLKISEKLCEKAKDNFNAPPVTIASLGDSVTQGCFEIRKKGNGIETVHDKNNAYHAHLSKILALLYPTVPVNIINAGVSGITPSKMRKIQ